ncbi:hypothetical protein DH2020_017045 [Rehmannia glutinosa]|uniref:At4g15545-like C-terminal domain-containing protein n=1 Tax=Rehmannia glutinosa TaxID=99300 RepID=A0ABR0WU15_REHGL
MAHGGGDSNRVGPDFNIPDEILSIIPTDPYDQLDLARKITSMAIASRVTKLETEAGRLRQKLNEKDQLIEELEDKMKILKERDSLALTAKKLSRDLAKDNKMFHICDFMIDLQFMSTFADESNGYTKHHSYSGSTDSASINDDVSKQGGQNFSVTSYITPRLTPTGTPKVISTSVSPRRYSAAVSPQKTSGATTPTTLYDGRGSLSSWYPSSQQSSAANSPPRARPPPGRTPRIDGKEFFRQARSRLSLEQFSAFLSNIKELNAQRQTREDTLRKAEEIFGMDNKDLYISFQGLLNRSVH